MMPTLAILFMAASSAYHLPAGLLRAVCTVESGLDPKAVNHDDGGARSLGICQVQLSTARQLGFKGTEAELQTPGVNVKYAAKYLAFQLERYDGNIVKAVAAYNMGSYQPRKKGGPVNSTYVDHVIQVWAWQEPDR